MNPDSCEKCASKERANTLYREGFFSSWYSYNYGVPKTPDGGWCKKGTCPGGEHLHVTCGCCGYVRILPCMGQELGPPMAFEEPDIKANPPDKKTGGWFFKRWLWCTR